MVDEHSQTRAVWRSKSQGSESQGSASQRWETPAFEVIPLDCEITAYAPDGDDPLF